MGFRLFHLIAVLEVMPHCDYLSSETSCTSPHSPEAVLSEKGAQPYFQVSQNSYLEHGRHS